MLAEPAEPAEPSALTALTAALVAQRERARAQVADLRAELAAVVESAAAAPPDDEHDAEGSTIGFERARLTALLGHAERSQAELDEAVNRLGSDGFGRCERCGGRIPAERLVALPATRMCVACAGRGQFRALNPSRWSP